MSAACGEEVGIAVVPAVGEPSRPATEGARENEATRAPGWRPNSQTKQRWRIGGCRARGSFLGSVGGAPRFSSPCRGETPTFARLPTPTAWTGRYRLLKVLFTGL